MSRKALAINGLRAWPLRYLGPGSYVKPEDKAKRILIIEDDRFISEMYARTLRKAGYTVEESMTGPEGLTKAKQGGWFIILLDIMLNRLYQTGCLNFRVC